MWQSWVTGIVGIWLIISSFIDVLRGTWNLLIFGIVVAVLSFWSATKKKETSAGT